MDSHDQIWSEHEVCSLLLCMRRIQQPPVAPPKRFPPPQFYSPPAADEAFQKVDLLAEALLKAGHSPSRLLLGFIRDSGIQVRWNELVLPSGKPCAGPTPIPLPSTYILPFYVTDACIPYIFLSQLLIKITGRSLASCHRAFEELAAQVPPNEYRHPVPPPGPIHYTNPARDGPQKRPHPESFTPIQPRPSQPPYVPISQTTYTATTSPSGEPANKKKRGRPPKAVTEARRQEAQAKGEPYPPPRKSRPSITARDVPQAPSGGPISYVQTPPGAAPLTTTATRATTPQATQPPESSTESSSGKKKSKPAPLDLVSHDMYNPTTADQSSNQAFSNFTPNSAPFSSRPDSDQHPSHTQYAARGPSPRQSLGSESRDVRMEGVEETQPRTTTPHSFKDTVGI